MTAGKSPGALAAHGAFERDELRQYVVSETSHQLYGAQAASMCATGVQDAAQTIAGEQYQGIASDIDPRLIFLERASARFGNALRAQKKYDEALLAYHQARRLRPDFADAINNMGTALRDMGRAAEAEATYRLALTLKPNDPSVLNNLALALRDVERFEEASALLARSLSLDPNNVKTLTYVALVRLDEKRSADAEQAARRALALAPDDPEATNAMGLVHYEQQDLNKALALFQRAVALKPDFADAHNNIGNLLKEEGQLAASCQAYEQAIGLSRHEVAYYVNFVDAKKFAPGDAHLIEMEDIAHNRDTLSDTAKYQLNFSLAKVYDDIGRYDDAFLRMSEANAIKRKRIVYDEPRTLGYFDRIRATFDRRLLETKAYIGCSSDLPVFVLGMPRSGTTLIEQILAAHPAVYGAGELQDFSLLVDQMRPPGQDVFSYPEDVPALAANQLRELGERYVDGLQRRAPQAKRVTDKMPANFLFLGMIHLALADAHIIHVIRDPLDTCLSCYSKLFTAEQNFTYDLGELGRYYRKYVELMAHWRDALPAGRVLDVHYEHVITDLEASARRIIDHCGLDWDPGCIAFHKAKRPVRTASATQVRRPIYRTSQGRWRAYQDHLGPLIAALGDVVDFENPEISG
jgi:tetratricopeptide (TPR) repeat protein